MQNHKYIYLYELKKSSKNNFLKSLKFLNELPYKCNICYNFISTEVLLDHKCANDNEIVADGEHNL